MSLRDQLQRVGIWPESDGVRTLGRSITLAAVVGVVAGLGAIVFHVIAYGVIRFALADVVELHFIHLYAVLFVIEVGIMLVCGWLRPREKAWAFTRDEQVDMTPWPYAKPLAVTLFSCVVATYLLFSPIGVASGEGLGALFGGLIGAVVLVNAVVWARAVRLTR